MPLEQLRLYKPSLNREEDFEQFWKKTTAAALSQPLNAELIPYPLPAKGLECYAVRFDGFGGGRIAGWYVRPSAAGRYAGLCIYHGYGGAGPRPVDLVAAAAQGICVLTMGCRGQNGQSQDSALYPEGHFSGWMTMGIRDPQSYYYRHVYADALRALELLAKREEVDEDRLIVHGVSQGGGITLAVAALSDRPALALPDVPFMCDYRRAINITPAGPYVEIPAFLKSFPHLTDAALRTLSYCDNLNLAPWITCKTIVCNCLCDDVCPPSTIYAVYNHMTAEKKMEIYPFHKHEVPADHLETRWRAMMEMV